MKDLTEKIASAFTKYHLSKHAIIIVNPDGHTIYTSQTMEKRHSKNLIQNMTVLLVGTLRAAQELGNLNFSNPENFKLTYSTSESGLVIENIKFKSKDYIAAIVYEYEVNPAKLRNQFKLALAGIDFSDESLFTKEDAKELSPFSNLSDDEINLAFDSIRI
jgi:hypothetical protein